MLEIRTIRGDFGAEARGVDLARPIDPEVRWQLNEAAARHAMLVIKGQSFDARQFLEAGRVFGEPMTRPYANPLPDLPLVQRLSSHDRREDGNVSKTGPDWHTDQIDDEHPPKYTLLYAVELFRTGGGTTGIIDMRAVYDALPGRLKERIEGLKAAYGIPRTGRVRPGGMPPGRGEAPSPPTIVHPLVRTNPDTGRRALYLHPGRVRGIVGVAPDEARSLLIELVAFAVNPRFVHNHDWTLGDMLMWDNRSTLHRANYDYDPKDTTQHRCMYRMMVQGERPQ